MESIIPKKNTACLIVRMMGELTSIVVAFDRESISKKDESCNTKYTPQLADVFRVLNRQGRLRNEGCRALRLVLRNRCRSLLERRSVAQKIFIFFRYGRVVVRIVDIFRYFPQIFFFSYP